MSIEPAIPSNHLVICHPLLLPSILPSIRVFSNELALYIRWSKHWSFNISPSNKYSRLISFRMDWLDLPDSPRASQESSPIPQFKSIHSLALSFLYGPALLDCLEGLMGMNPSVSPGTTLFSYFRGLRMVRGLYVRCLCCKGQLPRTPPRK